MCGLVGIFDTRHRRDIDRAIISRMNDAIIHRGPDGDGVYLGAGIGLGHRRLAIIDLSGGQQPLFNEDHTVAVVYNGEIYNFAELARELGACGHIFRTHCDTEVVVHAWEEWGEACLDRFRGMFAFALWDERRETLFLARDRLGKKPLYYTLLPDGLLLFGSELKALLVHPSVSRELDVCAIEEYFAYGYVPDPRSIYRGVSKLPPAHSLTIRRGLSVGPPQPYWDVDFSRPEAVDEVEASASLVARLREAVEMRLIADVPLGAFLSGGVDSSGVVAMMAGVSVGPVNTFSIAFGERDYDESRHAAAVAERYRTKHHARRVDPDEFELIDRLARVYDEPFGDSSALPMYRVCAVARERVTVALSGDGGDEVFAGYRRYRWHRNEERARGLLPASARRALFGMLGRSYPQLDWLPRPLRARATFQELAADSAGGLFANVAVVKDDLRLRLFSPAFRRELQGYHAAELLARHLAAAATDDPVAQAQYVDLKTYLCGDILTKVDRASMAHSLEVRAPLLDHVLVEWAARLPSSLKLRGREGKFLLKRSLEPYVPEDILYRPKQGFSVPLAAWFRGPLRDRLETTLLGPTLSDTGFFETAFIARLVEQHGAGVRDHSAVLWALLCFEAFLRGVHLSAGATATHSARAAMAPVPDRA